MELVVSAAAPSDRNEKGATSAKIFHVLDKSPKSPMKLAHRKLHPRRSSGALSERGIPLIKTTASVRDAFAIPALKDSR
jgi:hypothetical protein